MKKVLLIICISLLATWDVALAQSTNVGTAGAQFLKINASARAEGFAGAYVGMAQDATALFWNPAGIAHVVSNSASFTNIPWWTDVEVNQFAYVTTIERFGSIGISVINLAVPEQEITTVDEPDGTGRFFDANDLMIGVTYARFLLPQFSVGGSIKYIQQRIWNQTASTVAFDIGTQYNFGFRNLTLGMAVHNFGPDMQYFGRDLTQFRPRDPENPGSRRPLVNLETLDFPIPLNFQVGISMEAIDTKYITWLVTTDLKNPSDNYEQLSFGNELRFNTEFASFALRGGYTINNPDQKWAIGSGVKLLLRGNSVSFDYSYSDHEYLPGIQRLSFGVDF